LVERFWVIHWTLESPFEQETLPYPSVNMVFGTHRPGVHGVSTKRFVAKLEGTGWVVGVKFKPGCFRPWISTSVADLTDRELRVHEVFGDAGGELEQAVTEERSSTRRVSLIENFLLARRPTNTAEAEQVASLVELARSGANILRVADLASHAGLSLRTIERLFKEYVGVSPKWVVQRFRVQEAAERIASGARVDWAALAQDIGYFDQSHLIRDFKSHVGRTPGEYAKECSTARAQTSS
jgi:AraC-like DNA-binding protein